MQVRCNLVEFVVPALGRRDKRVVAGSAIERHQPIKAKGERGSPQSVGGLARALDKHWMQMIQARNRVDAEVKGVGSERFSGPHCLPCLGQLILDLGRRDCGKEQDMAGALCRF